MNAHNGEQSCNDVTTETPLDATDLEANSVEPDEVVAEMHTVQAEETAKDDDKLAHNEVIINLDGQDTKVELDEHGCYFVLEPPPFPAGSKEMDAYGDWYTYATYTHHDSQIRISINCKHVIEPGSGRRADFNHYERTLEWGSQARNGKKTRWSVHAPLFYAMDTKGLAMTAEEAVRIRNPVENPEDPKLSKLYGFPVAYVTYTENREFLRAVPPFDEADVIAHLYRVGTVEGIREIHSIHKRIIERKLAVSEQKFQKRGGYERERPKDLPVAGGETFTPKGKKAKREHAAKQAAKG